MASAMRAATQIRQDERAEAEYALRGNRPVYLWTRRAGRVRCLSLDAFDAVQRGAAAHPDARREPLPFAWPWTVEERPDYRDPARKATRPMVTAAPGYMGANPYWRDAAFFARVHAAARRDHPSNKPAQCAACAREAAQGQAHGGPPQRRDRGGRR